MHFKNTQLTDWKITDTPLPDTPLYRIINNGLFNYFTATNADGSGKNIKEIDYELTSINNNIPATPPGEVIIEPKSFIFTTYGSDAASSVLSLYIQTTSDGSMPGDPTSHFQPKQISISPIPDAYEASLIISRDFLQRNYLMPQLKILNFTNVTKGVDAISVDNEGCIVRGGINSNFNLPSHSFQFGNQIGGVYHLNFDDVNVNFSNDIYQFTFVTNQLKIEMKKTISINWQLMFCSARAGCSQSTHGTATATLNINKQFDLHSISNVTDTNLSLNFGVSSGDYNLSVDPGTSNSCWNNNAAESVSSDVRNHIGSVIPPISFKLNGLNFFKETNLLFPGQEVLTFDAAQGIHIPGDLIILGHFK